MIRVSQPGHHPAMLGGSFGQRSPAGVPTPIQPVWLGILVPSLQCLDYPALLARHPEARNVIQTVP
jgi:hypothetical protein